ncbi:hypothetical protein OE88DRAFT_1483274 [Heliocybe sulcata]|uniref:UvrD-like helicase ATP-binding domain-containing protein n=1 Tax=Heliocybe sulcata TaxID=5364 RepID=A0A5C3N2N2_9AGAM|nr:hypothetical protein OE88DRAFT_1483274 [Heliocybe sulcata]
MATALTSEAEERRLIERDSWSRDRIADTVDWFEQRFMINKSSFEPCVTLLLSEAHVLELFLSAASNDFISFFCKRIQENFPEKPEHFSTSIQSNLLAHLSLALLFLDYPAGFDVPSNLSDCRRSVELSKPVLEALPTLAFRDEPVDQGAREDDPFVPIRTKQKSQRQQKRSRQHGKTNSDDSVFRILGVDAPNTPQDAEKLGRDILEEQKEILSYYLTILRRPGLAEHLQKVYEEKLRFVDGAHHSHQSARDNADEAVNTSDESSTPSAYPIIQPMRAALYFESAKGLGDWHILVSSRADRDLRGARRKDAKTFRIIMKKIHELSRGHFSDDNQKRLTGTNLEIPIYEAKMTRDSRLVIDCIPEFDSDIERQVIKLFGVYTHADIKKNSFWEAVGHQLAGKGREYRRRCTFRNKPIHAGDNVIAPASFPPQREPVIGADSSQVVPRIPGEYLQEIHSLLVLEKFVTLSQALLNSILADRDVAHVFAVSPQEREIIEYPLSCYVIGRSGTGKTTTMLFKMLGIQRSWEHGSHSVPKPRQVFVTRSRVLASKVEQYFEKLMKSLVLSTQDPKMLAQGVEDEHQVQDDDLVDSDDDTEWRVDLPKRFSLLEDHHFPLFITFDHLCCMLEGDLSVSTSRSSALSPADDAQTNGERLEDVELGKTASHLVLYEKFLESYWPHMPQFLTKGLDPSLVFSEIMGVIKGSEQSLKFQSCCLDREAYNAVSHRSQSTFASQRDLIYSIFENYQSLRSQRRELDNVDRTHDLIVKLATESRAIGEKFDFLYVDEVQDNNLIDAHLLRSLCKNPNGLFWAGDTAQTISVGSSFKFNDLKAFLHRLERNADPEPKSRSTSLTPEPRTFHLAVNYRSHAGIVKCAHSVVRLITRFWPYAIDVLGEERGIVEGLRPVFFGSSQSDTVRYEQFLFGESGHRIDFGARQCILVRNEAARDELRKEVGQIGLIMTLYESKGLEFDDVLLYNFFKDSTSDFSQWRVVLNAMVESQGEHISVPSFDEVRHASICSELKFLYVAITRARNNLWIFDPSKQAEPMKHLWSREGLIDTYTPKMELPQLAVDSSSEEWRQAGRSLFENRRYFQAMHCFKRARMRHEAAISNAFYLRDCARSVQSNLPSRSKAFMLAAEAFCDVASSSGKDHIKRIYMRNAANCYLQGGDDERAAKAFYDAEEFTLAARQYHKAGLVDDAIRVVRDTEVEQEVAERVVLTARLFYFQQKEIKKAVDLFDSSKEELRFMEDYGFDDTRADILESMGRFVEAGEVHLAAGRLTDGIKVLLKAPSDRGAVQRAKDCLLDCFWDTFSLDRDHGEEEQHSSSLEQLLRWAADLEHLTGASDDEISMFKAIASRDITSLKQLGRALCCADRKAAALLCYTHVFKQGAWVQTASLTDASALVDHFTIYTGLLHDMSAHSDPCSDSSIRRLFGFRVEPQHSVLLPRRSFLFSSVPERLLRTLGPEDPAIRISRGQFLYIYRQSLREHILSLVLKEDDACRDLRVLRPCLVFTTFGRCRDQCPRGHFSGAELSAEAYNLRVRLHLQQILLLGSLYLVPFSRRERWQRMWLQRLYEALHPSHPLLGHISDLDLSRVPEASDAVRTLKRWLHGYSFPIKLENIRDGFLANFTVAASLGFLFDGERAVQYVLRAPCVISYREASSSQVPVYVAKFLETSDPYSLSAGIFFLRDAAKRTFRMDIGILCQIMEELCGALVLCRNYQNVSGHVWLQMHIRMKNISNNDRHTLHGTMLPQTWLQTLLERLDWQKMSEKDTRHLWVFSDAMASILKDVKFPDAQSQLMFEGRSLSERGGLIQNAFVLRICRCMCLLGYNILDSRLRTKILESIVSLKKPDWMPPALCAKYINATSWSDLSFAVRQRSSNLHAADSAANKLIQLHDARKELPLGRIPRGVHKVVYKSMDDLPRLFATSSKSNERRALEPVAEACETRLAAVPVPEVTLEQISEDMEPQGGTDLPEDIAPDTVEEIVEVDQKMVDEALPVFTSATDREIQAAAVIQSAYRRVHRRRTALEASLNTRDGRWWKACMDVARTVQWPNSYYKCVFLGPLVHGLVCLDILYSYASAGIEKTKKRLKEAQYQELEETGNRLTQFNDVLKRVNQLQTQLHPNSDLHKRCEMPLLIAGISDIQQVVRDIREQRMPLNNIEDCQNELDLAVGWIVKRKRPTVRKPLPQVVLDDPNSDFYDVSSFEEV